MTQGPGWNQNSHYALVRALADGTPKIDRTRHETGRWYQTGDISYYRGHYYSNKVPGLAFATLPAYLVLDAAGQTKPTPFQTARLWFLGLWSVVLPALVLLLLVRSVADDVEPGFGTLAALALGVSTFVLPFTTLFFAHVLSATLSFAAFAILWRERQGRARLWQLAAAGACVGYAATTELTCVISAAALGCYAMARSRALERGLAYAAGALAGVAPLLAYNAWSVGSPFRFAVRYSVGLTSSETSLGVPSFRQGVELLFSSVGLLTVTPIVALGGAGTVLLYRRGRRAESLVIGAVALGFVLFNASFGGEVGGELSGPRYMIAALPFLAVPLAVCLRRLPVTTLGLALVSAVEMVAVTVTHPAEYWVGYAAWFQELRAGAFSATVLSFFHPLRLDTLDLPASATWHPLLLFFVPLLLALALAAIAAPRVRLSWRDAARAAACVAGWLVVRREAPRFLVGDGVAHQWAPLVVFLLGAAVVVCAVALPAVFRPEGRASLGRQRAS